MVVLPSRPVLGEVGREILLLHVRAESGDVRLVDLQALPLEDLDKFLLAGEMLLRAHLDRGVGSGLEPRLLLGAHLVPHLLRHGQEIEADEM
jgi:hypothetical protein